MIHAMATTKTVTVSELSTITKKTRNAVTLWCWNFVNLQKPMPEPARRAWKDKDGHWQIEIEVQDEVAA